MSFYHLLSLEIMLFLAAFFAIPFALLKHLIFSRIRRRFDNEDLFDIEVSLKEKGVKDGLKVQTLNIKSI